MIVLTTGYIENFFKLSYQVTAECRDATVYEHSTSNSVNLKMCRSRTIERKNFVKLVKNKNKLRLSLAKLVGWVAGFCHNKANLSLAQLKLS